MHESSPLSNPFAMMIDPQAVIQAMEKSQKLNSLHSRVCRPLDTPGNSKYDDRDGFDMPMSSPKNLGRY